MHATAQPLWEGAREPANRYCQINFSSTQNTTEYVREQLPKIYSRELIGTIFEQPYCRISNLVEADIAKRQTASEYLKKLAGIGVLMELRVGRERIYVHPRLIELITKDKNSFERY